MPCAAWTSPSRPARSSVCSARTVPARPPRCACSPRCCAPRRARPRSPVPTSSASRARCGAASATSRRSAQRPRRAPCSARSSWCRPDCRACRRPRPRHASSSCSPASISRASRSARWPMSGGQRRRFDIALGLMHGPKLLFLDEPTTGLDPQSRANLWDHIRSLRDDHGATIVLTTHYLDEADALADRLLVMDNGTIVADDTPDALKARVSGDVVTLRVDGDLERALVVARDALETRTAVVDGDRLVLTVDRGDTAIPLLFRALDDASLTLVSVQVDRPTLDD